MTALTTHGEQLLEINGVELCERIAAGGRFVVRYDLEHPDQLAEVVATIADLRSGVAGPYDIAVGLPFDADPLPYAAAGATWWLPEFEPGVPLDTVRGILRDGPARSGD